MYKGKSNKHRIVSVILCVLLVFTSIPAYALSDTQLTDVGISVNSDDSILEIRTENEELLEVIPVQEEGIELERLSNEPVELTTEKYVPEREINRPHIPSHIFAPLMTTEPDSDDENQAMSIAPMAAAATPAIRIVSTTATSITFNATFPTSGAKGNAYALYDVNKASVGYTIPYGGSTQYYRTNGNFTISGLVQGGIYWVGIMWSTDNGSSYGGQNTIYKRVQLPYSTTEQYTRTNGSYVFTNVESGDIVSSSYMTSLLSKLDNAYLAYKSLTGITPYNGAKIELRSSRQDFNMDMPDEVNYIQWINGWSGNPSAISRPFFRGIMLRQSGGDVGDVLLHELSHSFDSWAWEFDSEFFAWFKEYYVVETLNAKVYREDMSKYYTGSQYANLFSEHGQWGYNVGFNTNYYNFAMGLAKIFSDVKAQIGWEPFKQTFAYFNNLQSAAIPNYGANMSRFNIFTTKLRDFSDRDVQAMITSRDKGVIQSMFGGTIAYGTTPDIETRAATSISSTTTAATATLKGYILRNHGLPIADYGFYYGTTPTESGMNQKISFGSTSNSAFEYSRTVTLLPGTTYYFKTYATNAYGTKYGSTLNFTTPGAGTAVEMPTASPGGQLIYQPNGVNVSLACTTPGATIRYTTNGSEPTATSAIYNTPIYVTTITTLKAKAFKTGMTPSETAVFEYKIWPGQPQFTTYTSITVPTSPNGLSGYITGSVWNFYRFTAPSSGAYEFTTTTTSSTLQTFGALYNSSKSRITYNSGNSSRPNFKITQDLVQGQVYYLGVCSTGYWSGGPYELYITKSGQNEEEPNNSAVTANTFAVPGNMLGTISSITDNEDWYKFSIGSTGAEATITLSGIPSGCNYDIELQQVIKENVVTPNSTNLGVIARSTKSGNTTEVIQDKPLSPGTYYLRVYSASGFSTSSYNINIALNTHTNIPTGSGALVYSPSSWNLIRQQLNCYAYALNLHKNPITGSSFTSAAIAPGFFAGISDSSHLHDYTGEETIALCEADASRLGITFFQTTRNASVGAGNYKVALVIAPGTDTHWYRQNSDGTWSHKPSIHPVLNYDHAGQTINDPLLADRSYKAMLDFGNGYYANVGYYPVFVGYFEVSKVYPNAYSASTPGVSELLLEHYPIKEATDGLEKTQEPENSDEPDEAEIVDEFDNILTEQLLDSIE